MTSKNPGFVPFTLVSINPNGSFTTKLEEPEEETASSIVHPRRHEVREGDSFLRRDGSTGPTYEVWAVEDGQEWCVEADIRGLRNARAIAKNWQRGYVEALSE